MPDLSDLLFDLLRAPARGINEVPDEVWDLDTPDIAAYLGVIAATPRKSYIADPPEEDWARVVHFLTVVGAEYRYRGRVEECLRQTRLVLALDEELLCAYRRASFYEAFNAPARVAWPLPNLILLEDDHEGSADSGDPELCSAL